MSRDHLLPEHHRLGVRIVDAEDPHPVRHPEPQHPQRLADDPGEVLVEGDRVDVLVLLRRVLGVGDGAVGAVREPLAGAWPPTGGPASTGARSPARPPAAARRPARTKWSKSSMVPRSGWIASWPPSGEPIAHGEPTSCGPGGQAVVRGPCGRRCRSGGSAAGTPRRSPSRRPRAAARPRCGRCPSAAAGPARTTAPSERGNSSYQEPYSARSRSTCSGIGREELTSSRSGWRSSASVTSGASAAACRAAGARPVSRSASTAASTAGRPSFFGTPAAARS